MGNEVTKARLEGVASLTITALNDDFSINEEANRKEIDWIIEKGANSLWFRGFIGEWTQLDLQISKQLIRVYADHGKGRTILAAGCHGSRPSETIELCNYADEVGCDLAWILAPPYPSSQTEESIYAFYETVIANTSIPLGIYNSAAMFIYMTPRVIKNIIAMAPDRFVAMKDSYGLNSHQTEVLRSGLADDIACFFMASEMILPVSLGNPHIMCVPQQIPVARACYDAVRNGDFATALRHQHFLVQGAALIPPCMYTKPDIPPNLVMFGGISKLIASEYLGIEMGPPAPPVAVCTDEERQLAKEYVQKWRLLDLDAAVPDDAY